MNAHTKELLGIVPKLREPIENDIATDEENLHIGFDVDSYSEEKMGPTLAGDDVDGNDSMEDL